MLILSAGMPKSGSAYLYNLINAILVETGNKDARQIKDERNLEAIMKWHNNNIGELSLKKLIRLWLISVHDGPFTVKTHQGPKSSTKALSKLGLIRIVYCYRDPRDALLSAVDHGKKILAEGGGHTFAGMVDFDKASKKVKSWLGIWKRYNSMTGVLMVRYEDLIEKSFEIMQRIVAFLKVSVNDKKLEDIIWTFSRNNPDGERTGMHFNKAKSYRYRTEFTEAQKKKCQDAFGEFIEAMGYEIE